MKRIVMKTAECMYEKVDDCLSEGRFLGLGRGSLRFLNPCTGILMRSLLYPRRFADSGSSSCVISLMNSGFGSNSMTWKCSTACTDFNAVQFLNQSTFCTIQRQTRTLYQASNLHAPGSSYGRRRSYSQSRRFVS